MKHPDRLPRPTTWTLTERTLLRFLVRARAGEDPDVLYAELYANSSTCDPDK